jgi:hypothetical protein
MQVQALKLPLFRRQWLLPGPSIAAALGNRNIRAQFNAKSVLKGACPTSRFIDGAMDGMLNA